MRGRRSRSLKRREVAVERKLWGRVRSRGLEQQPPLFLPLMGSTRTTAHGRASATCPRRRRTSSAPPTRTTPSATSTTPSPRDSTPPGQCTCRWVWCWWVKGGSLSVCLQQHAAPLAPHLFLTSLISSQLITPPISLIHQVMTYEQAEKFRWNPFDLTKIWPHKV